MKLFNISYLIATAILSTLFVLAASGQTPIRLTSDKSAKFSIEDRKTHEFSIELKADEICNITTDASEDLPLLMELVMPNGNDLKKDIDPNEGYVFVADIPGTYKLVLSISDGITDEELANLKGKEVSLRYSNKFRLPSGAKTAATRLINGYQVKIANEGSDEGKTFLVIQKAGKLKALMRAAKEINGGFYFSDDPKQIDGANAKASAALMRNTLDKTGDGTTDIAVEYYSGGAHCCFEITFFELGSNVRQLPAIDTANDRLTAIAKKPGGGLRFEYSEQAFAYWNINFAQSPMPAVIWEFDKSDQLSPRFDLMKKPAPSTAKLKRDAALMRSKIKLDPYTSPEDNFNDWEEPFWAEMLDLVYTGHEDLAWQFFDMVWPAQKRGKQKFRSDFNQQLSTAAYGERKRDRPR